MRTSLPPEPPAQVGCVSLGGGMYRVGAHAVKTQGKKGKLAKAAIRIENLPNRERVAA